MKQAVIFAAVALLAACDDQSSMPKGHLEGVPIFYDSKEFALIRGIRSADSAEKREDLIAELEATPTKIYEFYSRWLGIYEVGPDGRCWSDNGYDPSRSEVPRNIQLLALSVYGLSTICNSGFEGFFSGGTGTFAPEMIEWLQRAGLPEAARQMREASSLFGDNYPRSDAERQEYLTQFGKENGFQANPFASIEGPNFCDPEYYKAAANSWLRDVCGITNLRMNYIPEKSSKR